MAATVEMLATAPVSGAAVVTGGTALNVASVRGTVAKKTAETETTRILRSTLVSCLASSRGLSGVAELSPIEECDGSSTCHPCQFAIARTGGL